MVVAVVETAGVDSFPLEVEDDEDPSVQPSPLLVCEWKWVDTLLSFTQEGHGRIEGGRGSNFSFNISVFNFLRISQFGEFADALL